MRKILVFYPGALGDLLLAAPVFSALQNASTPAVVHLVGSLPQARILVALGLLSKIFSFDDPFFLPLFSEAPLPASFQNWLRSYEYILFWLQGPVHPNLAEWPRVLVVNPRPFPHPAVHHAQFLYNAVRQFFHLPLQNVVPFTLEEAPPKKKPPRLLIHPGSGSPEKNWEIENFKRLAERWKKRFEGEVLLLLGPAEQDALGLWQDWALFKEYRMVTSRSWPELLTIVRDADFYAGNDSGISHLSGLLGKSGWVFFRTTDPKIWRPLGRGLLPVKVA